MSEKHPGPLVVEGKLSDAERLKKESNFLRGTIAEDLNDGLTGGFNGDNFLLIRFHGMYQQDDRDIRAERAAQKLEPRHAMMLRCRLPGGIIRPEQWLAIDKFAADKTIYGSIRLTNRQTFQFHGILKKNVKPVHQMLHSVGLDALALRPVRVPLHARLPAGARQGRAQPQVRHADLPERRGLSRISYPAAQGGGHSRQVPPPARPDHQGGDLPQGR